MDWTGSVVPAQEHDDAALDDVEPGPLLLEGLAEAPLPPLASDKLHLALAACVFGWGTDLGADLDNKLSCWLE